MKWLVLFVFISFNIPGKNMIWWVLSAQHLFSVLQRLDSRGHRVRSLKQLRLSHALEVIFIQPPFSGRAYRL
jgi:hypothetical protein